MWTLLREPFPTAFLTCHQMLMWVSSVFLLCILKLSIQEMRAVPFSVAIQFCIDAFTQFLKVHRTSLLAHDDYFHFRAYSWLGGAVSLVRRRQSLGEAHWEYMSMCTFWIGCFLSSLANLALKAGHRKRRTAGKHCWLCIGHCCSVKVYGNFSIAYEAVTQATRHFHGQLKHIHEASNIGTHYTRVALPSGGRHYLSRSQNVEGVVLCALAAVLILELL